MSKARIDLAPKSNEIKTRDVSLQELEFKFDPVNGHIHNGVDSPRIDVNNLTGITIISPTDGEILKWDESTSSWVNSTLTDANVISISDFENHTMATTSVHGIIDTTDLALKSGSINQFIDITSSGANIEDAVIKRHNQNTDIGTSSSTFYIGINGPKIKNNTNIIELRNNSDTNYANLIVGNLTIKGTTTAIESETVVINDNIIVLNNNYSGSSPTENGGIEIRRGTNTNASIIWDESVDLWKVGLVNEEKTVITEGNYIELTGDIIGTAQFNSTGNLSITTTVLDNSHIHTFSTIEGLQSALNNKADANHTHTLGRLTDIMITSVSNNDVLIYDLPTSKWVNKTATAAGLALSNHNHDNLYLKINDTATNSEKLDGYDGSYYLNWNNFTNIPIATSTTNGILLAADWSKFNSKVGAVGLITQGNIPVWSNIERKELSNGYSIETVLSGSANSIPTADAVKRYVDNTLGISGAFVYAGEIDCSTNPNYPLAAKGETYRISVAGHIGGALGPMVDVGDFLVCVVDYTPAGDHTTVGNSWEIMRSKRVVIGPNSSTNGNIVLWDGTSGRVIKDSLFSPSSFQPANPELTSISNLSSNGLVVKTGPGAWMARTIIGGSGVQVTNGNGVNGNIEISHGITSYQSSVINSGRTYIQNIHLDSYGHVTSIDTGTDTYEYIHPVYLARELNLGASTGQVISSIEFTSDSLGHVLSVNAATRTLTINDIGELQTILDNKANIIHTHALNDLSDVDAIPSSGDTLVWNADTGKWQAEVVSHVNIALNDLIDVNTVPTDGDVLIWNSDTNEWQAGSISSGKTLVAEGNIVTLNGDAVGSAAFNSDGNISISVQVVDDLHNHIISNIDGLQDILNNKSDITHTHTLNDLTNVTITTVDAGEVLVYDSETTSWINKTLTEAGIAPVIHDHSNIYLGVNSTAVNSDKLNGQYGSFYRNAGNLNDGIVPVARLSGIYNISITGDANTVDGRHATDFAESIHSHFIDDLTNVTITTVDAGEVLVYDSETTSWINKTLTEAGIAPVIHDHDDIYLGINDTAVNSDKLDGKHAVDFAESGHTHTLNDLSDVNTVPADGHVLSWNGITGEWQSTEINAFVLKTGDTMSGALTAPEYQIGDNNTRLIKSTGNSIRVQTNNGYVNIGPQNTAYAHFNTDRNGYYFDKPLDVVNQITIYGTYTFLSLAEGKIAGNIIWHAGNDGHDSGLDADTVDGKHVTDFAESSHTHTLNDLSDVNTTPSDGDILTWNSNTNEWKTSTVIRPLISNITITVGNGGDFSTITAAISHAVTKYYPIMLSTGTCPRITIQLLSDFIMSEQVLVESLDLSWITITGNDDETVIDRSALTTIFGLGYPAFAALNGGFLPIIGQLFNMNTNGTITDRHGILAYSNSRAIVLPDCGVKNAGAYGIAAYAGSTINACGSNTSDAGQFGIYVGKGSTISAIDATGTTSQDANTVTVNGIIFK